MAARKAKKPVSKRRRTRQGLKVKTPVKTAERLTNVDFLSHQRHKDERRAGAVGLIVEMVDQGGAGFAYLVQHDGAPEPAIYLRTEIEVVDSYWRLRYAVDDVQYFKEFYSYSDLAFFVVGLGVEGHTIEGPFYESKDDLEEGEYENEKSLFDHLTEDV